MSETPTYEALEQKIRILEQTCREIQSQKQIIESEQLWHSVPLASPNFIFITDKNGRIQHVNHPPPGLSCDERIGTHINNYISSKYHAQTKKALDQVFPEAKSGTYQLKRNDTGPGIIVKKRKQKTKSKDCGQYSRISFCIIKQDQGTHPDSGDRKNLRLH